MTIEKIFLDASSLFTLISFLTFIGIIWWAFSARRKADFDEAANLPFADDTDGLDELNMHAMEKRHG
jgi:cytochrome c oxidase cbb3-type subunit 4